MNTYTQILVDGYERVVKCVNEKVGLVAYISVHNIQQGPALGGCRYWSYGSNENALMDVLRLSKAMTYKNYLADIPFGGGKSVIAVDNTTRKSPDLLKAMGEFVESLSGIYIIAEDVNISFDDLNPVRTTTQYVVPEIAGDPSPVTAKGVYLGMKGSWSYLTGAMSLQNVKVGVLGTGAVGRSLIDLLVSDGAIVYISDINSDNILKVTSKHQVAVVHPDDLVFSELDIFAPCALSGAVNEVSLSKMKARLIAGCANNQLFSSKDGKLAKDLNILYAPDYVINAGGVIQITGVVNGKYDGEKVNTALNKIPQTLVEIYHESNKTGLSTNIVANKIVENKLEL